MDDEELILEVEKNEIVYNKSSKLFKDSRKKQDVWKEIGEKLQYTGDTARKRWTNIRDAFHMYRKKKAAKKSGDGASCVKKYKYADILGFLIPHLKHRETSSNLQDDDMIYSSSELMNAEEASSDVGHNEDESQVASLATCNPSMPIASSMSSSQATPAQSSNATPMKRTRENSSLEVDKKILSYLNSSQKKEEDDIDLFFNSMAHSVRRLPLIKRAEVKFQIHQIVHGAELEVLSTAYSNDHIPSMVH